MFFPFLSSFSFRYDDSEEKGTILEMNTKSLRVIFFTFGSFLQTVCSVEIEQNLLYFHSQFQWIILYCFQRCYSALSKETTMNCSHHRKTTTTTIKSMKKSNRKRTTKTKSNNKRKTIKVFNCKTSTQCMEIVLECLKRHSLADFCLAKAKCCPFIVWAYSIKCLKSFLFNVLVNTCQMPTKKKNGVNFFVFWRRKRLFFPSSSLFWHLYSLTIFKNLHQIFSLSISNLIKQERKNSRVFMLIRLFSYISFLLLSFFIQILLHYENKSK